MGYSKSILWPHGHLDHVGGSGALYRCKNNFVPTVFGHEMCLRIVGTKTDGWNRNKSASVRWGFSQAGS